MKKRHISRAAALLLALLLTLSLSACGSSDAAGYEVIDTLSESGFVIAFRQGDKLSEYVPAALNVLSARGTISALAAKWFGEDETTVEENAEALDAIEGIPERDFILGFSANAAPMAYEENGSYTGFDIELARAVCELLGWNLKLQPINVANLSSELLSGNVDAVWGGLYEGAAADGIYVTQPYMNVDFVLVARAADGYRSWRSLSGKYLSMSSEESYTQVLAENPDLESRLASVSRLASGAAGCFAELETGACDAILVDSAAARYYMNRIYIPSAE